MQENFSYSLFGRFERPVFRLGLSATYRPGKDTIYKAFDAGVNFLFCFGFDTQMIRAVREFSPSRRGQFIIATGAYNLLFICPNLRKALEKRLRQLRTDYVDVFLFLGVTKPSHFPPELEDELMRLKEDGRVRAVGISCHDRIFAGELAARKALDVLMIRYNAAHTGAEIDIFPQVSANGPAIVSYTATCWRRLLQRPKGWPPTSPIATAPQCYRFALSSPHVDVCLMAPASRAELEEDLTAIEQGPLDAEQMGFMREFGAAVRRAQKWFM